jgi:hypothetical protein
MIRIDGPSLIIVGKIVPFFIAHYRQNFHEQEILRLIDGHSCKNKKG